MDRQRIRRSKRSSTILLLVLLVVLLSVPLPPLHCKDIEIAAEDVYSLTYFCNETDSLQFQEVISNKTALKVTFKWCSERCLSVEEKLFIKAINLKTLWLSYRQDNEDTCSATRMALRNATFAGLHSLAELHLEGFEKTVVDFGVFEPLRNLQTLRLERFGLERLKYSDLAKAMAAFSGTPLENIELNRIIGELSRAVILNIEDLFTFRNVSVKKLAFDNNIVPQIDGRPSKVLSDLEVASFGIQINYSPSLLFVVDVMTSLQRLQELHIYSYPSNTIAEVDYSKFILRELPIDIVFKLFQQRDLSCYWNHRAPLSKNLRKLRLNRLRFLKLEKSGNKLCFQDTNALEMLDLSNSPLPSQLPLITGLGNLKELVAKGTDIRSVSPIQMQQMQLLKTLDIAENDLDEDALSAIFNFRNQNKLELLNLSKCNLRWIPQDLASTLGSIQLLDLSQNLLTSADLSLEGTVNISLLNFSYNSIEYLSPFAMNELRKATERNASLIIDVSFNPLSCLCNATHSVEWLQRTGRRHLYGYDGYTCLQPNGSRVAVSAADRSNIESECAVLKSVVPNGSCPCDLEILTKLSHIRSSLTNYWCKNANGRVVQMSSLDPVEVNRQCFVFYRSAAFLAPLIVGLTVIVVLGAGILVLYKLKKEKRIEYLMPECLNPDRIIGTLMALIYRKTEGPRNFQHEAFVVYHDNDFCDVRQPIISHLQSQLNIKTPDDFELGAFKMDEIDGSISNSKWIVLLMSRDFTDDGQCKETVVRAIQRQHAIIPVLLETLDLQHNDLIQNLLNTNKPFIWPKDSYQQNQILRNIVDKIKSDHNMV